MDTKFDKRKSSIAITVPRFTLKKKHDEWFEGKYNEPYILSLAVDTANTEMPGIAFNMMPFPKIAEGGTVTMLGDGHLVYGPANPGEFVAISILMMEADSDIRTRGKILEDFIKSKAVDLGFKLIIASNPGAAAILALTKELTQFLAGLLKENKDDELFRIEGTFLRDGTVPYHINREYQNSNEYVELSVKVIPLAETNGQGEEVKKIIL
ncbi:MAG: hypothetical protein FVQ85_14040 [Planctomycetes bacterium]|nr:hypothetical protein [Planctomycetota bacterium]